MYSTAHYFQSKRESVCLPAKCGLYFIATVITVVQNSIPVPGTYVSTPFLYLICHTGDIRSKLLPQVIHRHSFPIIFTVQYLPTSSSLVEIIIDTEIVVDLKDNLYIELGKKAPCQLENSEACVLTAPCAANVSILWNLFSMRVKHITQLVWYAITVRES
jgi:hypothetical protein